MSICARNKNDYWGASVYCNKYMMSWLSEINKVALKKDTNRKREMNEIGLNLSLTQLI